MKRGWMAVLLLVSPSLSLAGQGNKIAATVDGAPIYLREVSQELSRVVGKRKLPKQVYQRLQKEMINRLVDKRLILQYLASKRMGASKQQIDAFVERLEKQLEAKKTNLKDFLKSKKLQPSDLRMSFAWQIGWTNFLNRFLTDGNLKKYFNDHSREFDGTKIRVAHILLKAKRGDKKARIAATKKLSGLRAQIVNKAVSFAQAARAHSQSPSAVKGGDIGLIGRYKPMPNEFSQVAFALDLGEVSKPVETAFGVHLIKCLEVKKGTKTWQDSRSQLNRAINNYLYKWTANQQRPKSKIVITKSG